MPIEFIDEQPQEKTRIEFLDELPVSENILQEDVDWGTKARAVVGGAADMMTLGWGQEALAGIRSLSPSSPGYQAELENIVSQEKQLKESAPGYFTGGQVAGALLPVGVPIAKGGMTIAKGAGIGALQGGVYGAGAGTGDAQERAENAALGGALGAVGGAGGVLAGRQLERIAKNVSIKSMAERARAAFGGKSQVIQVPKTLESIAERQFDRPPIENIPKAATKVAKALKKDFGKELDDVLELYKTGDMSLSDFYGKRTSTLAEAAALYPTGREIAEEAIESKAEDAVNRLLNSVRKNISGIDNYYTTADDIVNSGRLKVAHLYEKAGKKTIKNKDILQIQEIQDALNRAYKEYPTRLKDVSSDSIQALDYAKKVLDDDIEAAIRAGKNNLAGSRIEIKKQLTSIMDESAPEYALARAKAGDYLSVKSAMEEGRKALKGDSELVVETFKKLSDPEKQAYKIGYGKAIRDELTDKVREGVNPYNKLLKTKGLRERAQAILAPQEYIDWEKSLRAEDRLFKFRNKVLGGSPTSRRDEAKSLIQSGAIDSIEGVPRRTFENGIKKIKTKFLDGINDKTAARISEILYETDPIKKLQIIESISGSKNLTPIEKQTIERAYSLMSPRYDALYIKKTFPAAGGKLMAERGVE